MEEIIFARSPFWIKATSTDIGSARIRVRVWEGDRNAFPQFGFERSFVKSAVNGIIAMDVSDVILHEIPDIEVDNTPAVWAEVSVSHTVPDGTEVEYTQAVTFLATGGYVRGGVSQNLVASATGIVATLQSLTFGAVIQSSGTVYSLQDRQKIGTNFNSSDDSEAKFRNVVLESGFAVGVTAFVEPTYRFSPWRLRFENRFGVLEEIWLAHRSVRAIATKNASYTRSNFNFDTLTYDSSQHIEKQYNSVAYRKHENNTGWMPIVFNETIEDILLSDNKWLIDEDDVIAPVILEDKNVRLKEILNETVIQYSFKFRETTPINNVIR